MDRNIGWKGPLTAALLISAACGGASMGAAPQESSDASAETAGGDYGGAEAGEYGAEGGETMLAPQQQQTVQDYPDEVTQLLSDFDGAMELASPDCGRAGDLRDAICDLAERICTISDDNPEHEDVVDQCTDGRSRCDTARTRVGDRCPD